MALMPKGAARSVVGDLEFDTTTEDGNVVTVRVSEEALEDYASARDLAGDHQILLQHGLEDFLLAADKLYSRDASRPRKIVIRTRDLN